MIILASQFMWIAVILTLLIFVCLIRVILGPTIPDRVVALDATNTLVAAILVMLGVAFKETIYIDVAIVYVLLSFVSTLYFAKHLPRREISKSPYGTN